jgi:hypothetical protein
VVFIDEVEQLVPDDLNVALIEDFLVGEPRDRHAVHLFNVEPAISLGHLAGPWR